MMKTLFNKQSLFILCFFLLSSSLFSEESITFSANQLKGNTNEENQYTQLIGNAFIETSDMTIQANEIILSGKDFEDIEKVRVLKKEKRGGFSKRIYLEDVR